MEIEKRNFTPLTKRPFKPGFDMLPRIKQETVQTEIMRRCGWGSLPTFIKRKFGRIPLRPPEVDIIVEIFKVYNLDPWTGEYLTPVTMKPQT